MPVIQKLVPLTENPDDDVIQGNSSMDRLISKRGHPSASVEPGATLPVTIKET